MCATVVLAGLVALVDATVTVSLVIVSLIASVDLIASALMLNFQDVGIRFCITDVKNMNAGLIFDRFFNDLIAGSKL